MPEPNNPSNVNDDSVRFTSDGDILEIREKDTRPGKVSDSYRKWLEEKYGRKPMPPDEPRKEG